MLTLYTAVGILRFQDSIKEHKTPTVINNQQEYGLTEEEFFLWSSLAFQIRQIHELQSAFSERLKKHHRSENIPIEPYLNRLQLRGLIVKGDGLTGVDALYRLLGELYISPLQDSFSVRLFTCIYLCMKKKLHTKELLHYLKKPARTAIEDTVLQIAKKVQISTAELVTCVEQGIHPQNTAQLLTQLYETSDATFRTLAQDIQFTHAGYPIPFLNKLIVHGAIGFFCVLFGCIYGFVTHDQIFLLMSLCIGVGTAIRIVSLLHTIKMHDYTELTGTCTKREVSPLTKKQKIIFRSTDQKEYHFTFDKNIRLLSGHYYRLYFRNVANLSGEEKVTPDLLAYEELSSLNKNISSKNP